MADEPSVAPRQGERRGLDPAVLTFLHRLVDDRDEAHRREHNQADAAMLAALEKADEKLDDLGARLTQHYDTILSERDNKYAERFTSSQLALREAATTASESIKTALLTAREETNKTEANWVKTADATFVKLEQLQTALSKVVPREESDRTQKENDRRFSEQDRRLTSMESVKVGRAESQFDMRAWMVAIIAAIGLGVTIVVAFGRV